MTPYVDPMKVRVFNVQKKAMSTNNNSGVAR